MILVNYMFMCLIFGTTFLAIKIGIDEGMSPFFSAGVRFFIAGLLLFLFMVMKGKAKMRLFLQKEMFITSVGLTFGTFAPLYWAEQFVTSGIAAVLSATSPILIILFQSIFFKKKENLKVFIGCLVGIIGVMILLLPNFVIKISSMWFIGCCMILVSAMFYALGTIYTKHVVQKYKHASPIALNATQIMHGGILLFILSLFTENIDNNQITSSSIISLVYLIIFGSIAGHSLYYWLVSKTNSIFPSTWVYISPLIAVILGVFLYSEYFSWITGLGALTIMLGTILINFDTLLTLVGKRSSSPRES
ncbi:DMT family transporter [Heyndrickxia oleronia]|uniref:DMT family transporter n=1 Tax=Heyndrickxia oleronia TaxID=38875 RepID=UPI00242EB792|nr:EamA family transporter [Heyndrickxia oleronia]MCI1592602.1 EamA family transporter [Heyndrickxia oleronia]MCI1614819.1 EamA family transporter [Heyndrickxia oleronia]MCI1762706.1 EamA family transporter [Heyndrickxia oleronia]